MSISAANVCPHDDVATVESAWLVGVWNEEQTDIQDVRSACLRCGLVVANGWILNEKPLYELRVRDSIGRSGTWRSLGLPRFHRVGRTIGITETVTRTIRRRRMVETIANLSVSNLEGLIRKYMGLDQNLWPIAVDAEGWKHPVIMHHGLALKFARKHDVDHTISDQQHEMNREGILLFASWGAPK